MNLAWPDCLACGNTIMNRICRECMQNQTIKWLEKENPGCKSAVVKAGNLFDGFIGRGSDCARCGGNLNVCGRCYTVTVHKALRKNSILASEFLDFASAKGFMAFQAEQTVES